MDPELQSQFYGDFTYEDEMAIRQPDFVNELLSSGLDPALLEDTMETYMVNSSPSFSTRPEENKDLMTMIMAREAIANPALREDPTYEKAYELYGKISSTKAGLSSLSTLVPVTLDTLIGQGEGAFFAKSNLNPDAQKAFDWASATENAYDPTKAQARSTKETIITIGGFVADTLILNKLIGGDLKTVEKAIRTKGSTQADSFIGKAVSSKFTNYALTKGKPITDKFLLGAKVTTQVAEDLAMGTAFSLRDMILNPDLKDMERSEQIKQLGSEFGVGVAADFVLNAITNLAIPGVKNYKRMFFNPRAGKTVKEGAQTIDDAIQMGLDAINLKVDPNTLDNLRRQGLGEFADAVETLQKQTSDIRTLKELGHDELATVKMIANSNNMDIEQVEGGYKIIENTLNKKSKTKTVANLNDVVKEIDNRLLDGLAKSKDEVYRTASLTEDFRITQKFEGTLQSKDAKLNLVEFNESILPRSGSFDARTKNDALRFTKVAMNDLGEGVVENLDDFTVRLSDDFFKVNPSIGSKELVLPRQITNGIEQKKYIKYIGDFITHHGNEINDIELKKMLDVFGDLTGEWSVRDMDWITSQAKKLDARIINHEGKLLLDDGVDVIPFENEEVLSNYVYSKTITDQEYSDYLNVEKGMSISKDPETELVAVYDQFKDKVAVGRNIEEIMLNNSQLQPKYPLRTGPKLAFITDSGRDIRFDGDFIEGSVEQFNDYMNRYSDMKRTSDIRNSKKVKNPKINNGTRVRVNNAKARWYVEAPTSGMKPRIFKSEKALKKFMDSLNTPQKTLMNVAKEKGVSLTATRAGYILQKVGEPDQFIKTYDEVLTRVKALSNQAPMPEALERVAFETEQAKEMFGDSFKDVNLENFTENQNVAILKAVGEAEDLAYASKGRSELVKKWNNLFDGFRDSRAVIRSMTKGNPDLLPAVTHLDNLIEVEKQIKTVQAQFYESVKSLNKLVDKDRRKYLGNLLSKELPEEHWGDVFTKLTGETLTDDDLDFVKGVRKIFDDAAKINGFGDSLDRIENYFPRLKTIAIEDILNPEENAISLAKKAYGRELSPAENKFFQNMRAVDLAGYAYQDDPLSLMRKYVDDTLKSNLLEPAVENLTKFAQNNITDPKELSKIMGIGAQARGLNADAFTEHVKELSDSIYTKFYHKLSNGMADAVAKGKTPHTIPALIKGKTEELTEEVVAKMNEAEKAFFNESLGKHGFRQNPLNKIMGAVTLSTQAFKPWLPIRNSFQPETHLAPIFGFEAIARAKKEVGSLSDEAFQYLARTSVFQAKTPQEMLGNVGQGRVAKMNEIGLASYKASDDFDRAVGFVTVKNALEEGLETASNWGEQAGDYFMEHTKLYSAPQNIRDGVLDAINGGNLEQATHVYANWMNSMVFLDYSAVARPKNYNSFLGKMFGQMGTFSTQTFSSRKYFTERLSKKDTAMYVGRAVLGGFALNSAFSEVTGSEVNNFSTLQSMVFAGGPLVSSAFDISQAVGGTDINRTRAIENLKYKGKSLFTPWNTLENIGGGIYQMAQGDIHEGFLRAGNFPGKGKFRDTPDTALKYLSRI